MFLNPVAQALTGWQSEGAVGKPLDEVFRLINEDTRQPAEAPIATVLVTGTVLSLANHTTLIAKDGREIPIDDSAAPVKDEEGRVLGVIIVFRNITARRQTEEALARRTAELQRANDELQQFAHIVSHDLQEPLRTVANFVQLLARRYHSKLDADTEEFITYAIEGT